jgi:hypothetical protein
MRDLQHPQGGEGLEPFAEGGNGYVQLFRQLGVGWQHIAFPQPESGDFELYRFSDFFGKASPDHL